MNNPQPPPALADDTIPTTREAMAQALHDAAGPKKSLYVVNMNIYGPIADYVLELLAKNNAGMVMDGVADDAEMVNIVIDAIAKADAEVLRGYEPAFGQYAEAVLRAIEPHLARLDAAGVTELEVLNQRLTYAGEMIDGFEYQLERADTRIAILTTELAASAKRVAELEKYAVAVAPLVAYATILADHWRVMEREHPPVPDDFCCQLNVPARFVRNAALAGGSDAR